MTDMKPGPDTDDPVPQTVTIDGRTIWQAIGAVLVTLTLLWALNQASHLVGLIVISLFFSLALQPAVTALHRKRGWRRGAAVGVIYLGLIIFLVLMVVFLIPLIAMVATTIGENGATWLEDLNTWTQDTFDIELFTGEAAERAAVDMDELLSTWANRIFGALTGFASTGIGVIFDMATIAMFTFYLTADAPRFQRTVLSFFKPDTQQRLGWTWDEAVVQTGGYFYSRTILMVINGFGFFFTMVLVGMPVAISIPLSLIAGFISVFIPAIGTYIGSAIPILLTLAIQGLVPALIVLAYAIIYQQIENYWLSPKISADTMTLNGAVAFGAALAGGAIAGPIGAFMALPVAALITAFVSNYVERNEVVYHSEYEDPEDYEEPAKAGDGS